jgi:hypothetical protein
MSSVGLEQMFEGDFADMCAKNVLFCQARTSGPNPRKTGQVSDIVQGVQEKLFFSCLILFFSRKENSRFLSNILNLF